MECVTCVCVLIGEGWGGRCWGEWVRGLCWALSILEEHGESGICVCVLVAVVWVLLGEVGGRLGSGRVGWCYVCVCCESRLFVLMACPGICLLC